MLKQDVHGTGKAGDIVTVSDGYASNFLIPRGLAENGRLFGAVTGKEIAAALKEQFDITVDKKKIRIDEPIKAVGIYTVCAHMFEQTDANFKVEVLGIAE